jgi:hypothetical protein
MTPATLSNPAARRTPKNYSIEVRVQDLITEDADRVKITESEVVNQILKLHYGIVN